MATEPRADVVRTIRRTLRWLVAWTVALSLGLIATVLWTWMVAHENQGALCSLRADLAARVQASREFLVAHPDGVAGISAKVIQDGIDNQQRTIVALSRLNCD